MKMKILILLFNFICFFAYADNSIVYFEDPVLEAEIRDEIDKLNGTIVQSDLLELFDLTPVNNIKSLKGVEYCINLKALHLKSQTSLNLSPISKLNKLEYLSCTIKDNSLLDISFLSNIASLKTLYISNNQIEDISPLKNLVNLETINLSMNNIKNLEPLENLINLSYISLANNKIKDLAPLKSLIKINYLSLSKNQLYDLSALKNLTKLENLYLNDNQLSDISALSDLVKLSYLDLSNNKISDISPFINLIEISKLILNDNEISDISVLETLYKKGGFQYGDDLNGDRIELRNNNPHILDNSDQVDIINNLRNNGVFILYGGPEDFG